MSLGLAFTEPALLLLLEPRDPASIPAPAPAPWKTEAARLLARARDAGCLVAHLFAGPLGEACRWRVVPELRPNPAEPVFYLDAGEPLSHPALAALVDQAPRAPVILAGKSVSGACLAAAVHLVTDGRRVSLARQALACSPKEWRGLEALASLPVLPTGGRLRLEIGAHTLPLPRPQLRVIAGGRR